LGETDQKYTGRKKTAGQKAYKEENQMEAYQNTALSPEERAKDLLGRMTLKEKVGQLNQRLYGFRIYERQGEEFTLTDEFKEEGDIQTGINLVKRAVEAPLRQIAENAGLEGSVIVAQVKSSEDGVGFNALKEEYVDMVKAGIVDPAKVTRTALQNAASIAALVLTTETLVADKPEPAPAAPAAPAGMGGMPGMM
jgi:hypothetical protein